MSILLGWMWAPSVDERDVYAVAEGFERWSVEPAVDSDLPWRTSQPDASPLLGHFIAGDLPGPGLARFPFAAAVELCLRRLRRVQFDVGGKIFMSVVTDNDGVGLGLQLEVAAGHEALLPALAAVFTDSELVLYDPVDDILHSRGGGNATLLSSSSGHRYQPAWTDIERELKQHVEHSVVVFENQRGGVIRVRGAKAALVVDCRVPDDSLQNAIAGRGDVSAKRTRVPGADTVYEHEVLTLDDAFRLFKTFHDDGVRSPWFTWRAATDHS